MGAPGIRAIPYPPLKAAAPMGDLARQVGWAKPPITSFGLRHLLIDMVFDRSGLERSVGPLPYSVEDGLVKTVRWMRTGRSE